MGNRRKHEPAFQGWLKTAVTLMIALAAVAGAGHVNSGPASRPATACVQLQVLYYQVGVM